MPVLRFFLKLPVRPYCCQQRCQHIYCSISGWKCAVYFEFKIKFQVIWNQDSQIKFNVCCHNISHFPANSYVYERKISSNIMFNNAKHTLGIQSRFWEWWWNLNTMLRRWLDTLIIIWEYDDRCLGIYTYHHMDVSKNTGTPKSSILIRFSIINHPFWGTSIFGNIHIYLPSIYILRHPKISCVFHRSFFFSSELTAPWSRPCSNVPTPYPQGLLRWPLWMVGWFVNGKFSRSVNYT